MSRIFMKADVKYASRFHAKPLYISIMVTITLFTRFNKTTLNIYSRMFQQAQARVSNAVSEALDFHKDKDKNDEKTA